MKTKAKEKITAADLRAMLKGKRVHLDCGHHFTLHPWSNVLVLRPSGAMICSECDG